MATTAMDTALPWLAAGLATWRLTHLVASEDGPWNVVVHLRRLAGTGWLGDAMDCFHCASLWMALPFAAALSSDLPQGLLGWLALSGAAILLERSRT
jgi:hypothetical protein